MSRAQIVKVAVIASDLIGLAGIAQSAAGEMQATTQEKVLKEEASRVDEEIEVAPEEDARRKAQEAGA